MVQSMAGWDVQRYRLVDVVTDWEAEPGHVARADRCHQW